MTKKNKIRIVMADDHPLFRSGLRQIIEEEIHIEIIGEAENGQIALEMIIDLNPDIVLLDIDMPVMNGIEVTRELNKLKIKPKIIFLTVHADEEFYDEGMELGISGYVLKDDAISEIKECINKVYENKIYISPSVSNLILNKKSTRKIKEELPDLRNILTKSELIILKMISSGNTTKEISEMLGISYKTAENHRTNISSKLDLKGSNSLIKFAIENKSNL